MSSYDTEKSWIAAILGVILVIVLVCFIVAYPVMLLWNWLIPEITQGALKPIGFLQALGLIFLCNILFGAGNSSRK